jgi:hypothetical protein
MGKSKLPLIKATKSAGLQPSRQKPAAKTVGYTLEPSFKNSDTLTNDKPLSLMTNTFPTTDTSSSTDNDQAESDNRSLKQNTTGLEREDSK